MLQRAACGVRPRVSGWRSSAPSVGSGGRALRVVPVLRAEKDEKVTLIASLDEDAANVSGEYCSIDVTGKKEKRTIGEMETVRTEAPRTGVDADGATAQAQDGSTQSQC
eukprot:353751-Chlamydomonas_euryale.AAC.3